jgi:hypothetical protein
VASRLDALARRVVDDPFFLGEALAAYARSEGLDDAGLAAALGCSVEGLARLRLCRRPDPARFGADVARIAERFGARADALAEAVRRADALAALRDASAGAAEAGLLMAARDRDEDDEG